MVTNIINDRVANGAGALTLHRLGYRNGQETTSFRGPQATYDGLRLITGSDDRTLRVWDADSGEELLLIDGTPSWIRQCSISQDSRQLAYFCTTDELKKSEITILGGSER